MQQIGAIFAEYFVINAETEIRSDGKEKNQQDLERSLNLLYPSSSAEVISYFSKQHEYFNRMEMYTLIYTIQYPRTTARTNKMRYYIMKE